MTWTIARKLRSLLEELEREEEQLTTMNDLWENHGDPGSDPGLQFEQEARVQELYSEFFAITAKIAPRYDGTNLHGYVIIYQDGAYESQVGSGNPVASLKEAQLFETEELANEHAVNLVDVRGVYYAAELCNPEF